MPKKMTRAERWDYEIVRAQQAIEELVAMQSEFEDWYDSMPENLQGSPTGEMLEEIVNIDLDSAETSINEAAEAQIPKGFGRD
jgi:hypothetical protein|tara:strand:+ start:317 stop:565 length:249 start_codon:yes stop_codon:yes gene_type:complete